LLCSFFAFLGIVLKNTFSVLTAKINYKQYKKDHLTKEEEKSKKYDGSLLFFDTIAKHSVSSLVEKEKTISEEEFFNDISTQIFFNARRCVEKFTCYNKALKFSIFLFINTIALIIVSFL
jgi:hypothetical protein